ncbi:hypothetical protein Goshw_001262, partial [Gossypium schwendimanii]|nr:hypothetical protein [Gossypium schwendimanii]
MWTISCGGWKTTFVPKASWMMQLRETLLQYFLLTLRFYGGEAGPQIKGKVRLGQGKSS